MLLAAAASSCVQAQARVHTCTHAQPHMHTCVSLSLCARTRACVCLCCTICVVVWHRAHDGFGCALLRLVLDDAEGGGGCKSQGRPTTHCCCTSSHAALGRHHGAAGERRKCRNRKQALQTAEQKEIGPRCTASATSVSALLGVTATLCVLTDAAVCRRARTHAEACW
jgi:hypothetical protein